MKAPRPPNRVRIRMVVRVRNLPRMERTVKIFFSMNNWLPKVPCPLRQSSEGGKRVRGCQYLKLNDLLTPAFFSRALVDLKSAEVVLTNLVIFMESLTAFASSDE